MAHIIRSENDLKDPFRCYCIFQRFIEEAGEDYIDYNDDIIDPVPFVCWMKGRGDISEDQFEKLMNIKGNFYFQEVLNDKYLFPNTYGDSVLAQIKIYTILAEYMCQLSNFRKKLWASVHDEATNFEDEKFYTDENGISLACIIDNGQMRPLRNFFYKDVLTMSLEDFDKLSYKTEFNLGREMSFEQADVYLDFEKPEWVKRREECI